MKIRFLIAYRTNWGEELKIHLRYGTSKSRLNIRELTMATTDGYCWCGEADLPKSTRRIEYFYQMCRNGHVEREEWHDGGLRVLPLDLGKETYTLCDHWKDIPVDAYLYTSAFTRSFTCHAGGASKLVYARRTLLLRVEAPTLGRGKVLALSGSLPEWGEWDVKRAIRLMEVTPHVWMTAIDADTVHGVADYKFMAVDGVTGEEVAWELRDNRRLSVPYIEEGAVVMHTLDPVVFPYASWKGAGCVIPVFSLRSEGSFGVGDFGDLKRMVDWVALTGQHVLQILPINDTTMTHGWTDSYPYNSISIYAFHPQYVDVRALPPIKDKERRRYYEVERLRLNALEKIDYEEVNRVKRAYLREIFLQQGKKIMESNEYKEFYDKNSHWLRPYAAFSYLRDVNGTSDFRDWRSHSVYDKQEVDVLCTTTQVEIRETIDFYCYLQYLLHVQLLEAGEYARRHGVVIKGDIPIGISRCSVEAWVEPHYFNMNGQAGAPPDVFSLNGQNWGFPTYDWDAMQADGCRWWVQRFGKMAEYFDAYRIDHVLGFFRIWEIPLHSVHGLLGQFSPALPMSPEEIEGYGLHFQKEFFTRPYITDEVLSALFGERALEVSGKYLLPLSDGSWLLKPEYDTQRKVEALFWGELDEETARLRDGLYSLISNVLFLPDRKNQEMYHPRICAQNDFFYQSLTDEEKEAFNRLYNDYYYHRHDRFWYDEAMKKLPVLTRATRMLVCAEDLGMVPGCVPWVMNDLRILTLEIQSMSKSPYNEFAYLHENPYRSVATISTHDMATLRGWWDEDSARTQRYYNQMLHREGDAPHPMPADLCEEVVRQHLQSPSMLCLLSFQDWVSIDDGLRCADIWAERINVPANPRNYWQYRMHLSIEQLMECAGLNEKIRQLVRQSGRE